MGSSEAQWPSYSGFGLGVPVKLDRLLAVLSPDGNSLYGLKTVFTSSELVLTKWSTDPLRVELKVSIRISSVHDCFSPEVRSTSASAQAHKDFFFVKPYNKVDVVDRVLRAMPLCSSLTHAKFVISGFTVSEAERLLSPLCAGLRSTPGLSSLQIHVRSLLPNRNSPGPASADNDSVTIRRFSPTLLVMNPTLQTLILHSDSHCFDWESAREIALFLGQTSVLESLDLRLLVTSGSTEDMRSALQTMMEPLSDKTRNKPGHVSNTTLRELVLRFVFWNLEWQTMQELLPDVHLAGFEVRGFVGSDFFACSLLRTLSLSLLSLNVDDGAEVIHVAADMKLGTDGRREFHIRQCNPRESLLEPCNFRSSSAFLQGFIYTGYILYITRTHALILHNPAPASLQKYIPTCDSFMDSAVRTIKVVISAAGEDVGLQRERLKALVSVVLQIEARPESLRVELVHQGGSPLSRKTSKDVRKILHDLRDATWLQSFVLDDWELRRVDGVLRPRFAGEPLCGRHVLTQVYDIIVQMK